MRGAAVLSLAALLSMPPVMAAHGDDEDTDAHEITVDLGEMYFRVAGAKEGAPLTLEAGESYRLAFVNRGEMKHEILLGRGLVEEDGVPEGYRENFFDGVEVELEGRDAGGGEYRIEAESLHEVYLDPEGRIAVTFIVPETRVGGWELGCFIAGHYEGGMKLPVRISSPE